MAALLLATAATAAKPMPANRAIKYQRPPLADYQVKAIFNDARYALVEASTKSGKTHACLAWLFEQAALTGRAGRNYWWLAPVYSQAEVAYRRLKLAIPEPLRKPNDSALSLTLPHKAVVWFKSAEKPDNLYGEDVYAAVVDEASRVREEASWALRSTVTKTEAPVRFIGNVKGRRNWFYRLCRKAEAGEPGHHHSVITAADAVAAGILSAEEVEDARRMLPANVFGELFEAKPSDDAGNPFGLAAIRAAVQPLSAGPAVAFGVDLGKEVDWTVIIGLDAAGRACAFERFQAPWSETMNRIHAATQGRPTLVDSTGLGDPVLELLQREGGGHYEGYKFTSESKQRLMEGLAVAIQRGEVAYPDGPIAAELEAFEFDYTRTGVRYQAAPGAHDDAVCALALAVAKKRASHFDGAIPAAPEAPYEAAGGLSALEGLDLG